MEALHSRWTKLLRNNPEYRKGQALFNACHELYPDIADELRGSDCDPFYDSTRIPMFLDRVEKRLQE